MSIAPTLAVSREQKECTGFAMAEGSTTARPPRGQFLIRFLALAMLLGPLSYVASISSTAVHEILGHGLTAWLLGGTFSGFVLLPDGMGWAYCECKEHWVAKLAAGMAAAGAVGLLLLAVCIAIRRSPLARLSLLVFAMMLLLDQVSYGFWNALFPRPPGDLGRILAGLQTGPAVRCGLAGALGITWLTTTFGACLMMWRSLEDILGRLDRGRALLTAAVFVAGPGVAYWLAFDWNQLIEGVGYLPAVTGACLHALLPAPLIALRRNDVSPVVISPRRWAVWLWASWIVCASLIAMLLLWFRHGVFFA